MELKDLFNKNFTDGRTRKTLWNERPPMLVAQKNQSWMWLSYQKQRTDSAQYQSKFQGILNIEENNHFNFYTEVQKTKESQNNLSKENQRGCYQTRFQRQHGTGIKTDLQNQWDQVGATEISLWNCSHLGNQEISWKAGHGTRTRTTMWPSRTPPGYTLEGLYTWRQTHLHLRVPWGCSQ